MFGAKAVEHVFVKMKPWAVGGLGSPFDGYFGAHPRVPLQKGVPLYRRVCRERKGSSRLSTLIPGIPTSGPIGSECEYSPANPAGKKSTAVCALGFDLEANLLAAHEEVHPLAQSEHGHFGGQHDSATLLHDARKRTRCLGRSRALHFRAPRLDFARRLDVRRTSAGFPEDGFALRI